MSGEWCELGVGAACLPLGFSNVYLLGEPGEPWVLVDTGAPGHGRLIRRAAERRFGPGAKPLCIVLTHGHFDHAGNALELANFWDIPILAHRLELPYLTGKSKYPPCDPTAPGFLAFLSRFFGPQGFDFGSRVQALPFGDLPGPRGWRWVHTPGHSPGHISLFRPDDAILIAGDAFSTVDLDSLLALIRGQRRISRPPTPFTCDWPAAAESVKLLDRLNPLTFACGHGSPIHGADAADRFESFANRFPVPATGRYVSEPAATDETGVRRLPPAPPDRAPGIAGAAGVAALAGILFAVAAQRRQRGAA